MQLKGKDVGLQETFNNQLLTHNVALLLGWTAYAASGCRHVSEAHGRKRCLVPSAEIVFESGPKEASLPVHPHCINSATTSEQAPS